MSESHMGSCDDRVSAILPDDNSSTFGMRAKERIEADRRRSGVTLQRRFKKVRGRISHVQCSFSAPVTTSDPSFTVRVPAELYEGGCSPLLLEMSLLIERDPEDNQQQQQQQQHRLFQVTTTVPYVVAMDFGCVVPGSTSVSRNSWLVRPGVPWTPVDPAKRKAMDAMIFGAPAAAMMWMVHGRDVTKQDISGWFQDYGKDGSILIRGDSIARQIVPPSAIKPIPHQTSPTALYTVHQDHPSNRPALGPGDCVVDREKAKQIKIETMERFDLFNFFSSPACKKKNARGEAGATAALKRQGGDARIRRDAVARGGEIQVRIQPAGAQRDGVFDCVVAMELTFARLVIDGSGKNKKEEEQQQQQQQ